MIRVLLFFRFCLLLLCSFGVLNAIELEHHAYVWQRNWSPRLLASIQEHASRVDGLTVLVSELSPAPDGGSVVRLPVDFQLLGATSQPISLAIRVGNYTGPFDAEQPMTQRLLHEVQFALATAVNHGMVLSAIEIDFDCATSRLEGYAEWLRALRPVLGEVPLSITTLPTWMNRSEAFGDLVRLTDHFVLQVHSVKRPSSIDSQVVLCDSTDAVRWAHAASRYEVPFHVALPTYGYRVAFDAEGALAGVFGEDASPIDDPELRYRVIRAEPLAMSQLVREFDERPPTHCLGIIWYRLPIGEERLNWDALTWRAVMTGQVEHSDWVVQAVKQDDGLIELQIEQTSALATQPPQQIIVQWGARTALAWDGQRNYSVTIGPDHSLIWQWPESMTPPLLPQGTRWTIGWLRMDAAAPLNFTILPSSDFL